MTEEVLGREPNKPAADVLRQASEQWSPEAPPGWSRQELLRVAL